MVPISVNFDDAAARNLLAEWMAESGKALHDAILTAARVSARSYGEKTWPKTLAEGTGAVETQIRRVYATQNMAYQAIADTGARPQADAFLWNLNNGKPAVAKKILAKHGGRLSSVPVQKFDGGKWHDKERHRNKRGRILSARYRMVVQNDTAGKKGTTALDRYIVKKQNMVGFTQAAWYNILRTLGGSNRRSKRKDGVDSTTIPFPKWVIRHKTAGYGEVTWHEGANNIAVTLHNNVRWSAIALGEGEDKYLAARSKEHLLKSFQIALDILRNK